jgi:hypothetical protein
MKLRGVRKCAQCAECASFLLVEQVEIAQNDDCHEDFNNEIIK